MKKIYLLATLFLLGCFGAQDQPSSTGSGTAMDGYLFGSTVFIDYDEDGIHDDDEPSAITDELGNYSVAANDPSELADYPFVVLSKAGITVDMDNPEGPIDEDFSLSSPPGEFGVVSPITTVVAARVASGESIEDAKNAVIADYGLEGLNPNDLMGDYIAAKSSGSAKADAFGDMHKIATAVTSVLKIVEKQGGDTTLADKLTNAKDQIDNFVGENISAIKSAANPQAAVSAMKAASPLKVFVAAPASVFKGHSITATGRISSFDAIDETDYSYSWSSTGSLSGSGEQVSVTFSTTGEHSIGLTVTKISTSDTFDFTKKINVTNPPATLQPTVGNELIIAPESTNVRLFDYTGDKLSLLSKAEFPGFEFKFTTSEEGYIVIAPPAVGYDNDYILTPHEFTFYADNNTQPIHNGIYKKYLVNNASDLGHTVTVPNDFDCSYYGFSDCIYLLDESIDSEGDIVYTPSSPDSAISGNGFISSTLVLNSVKIEVTSIGGDNDHQMKFTFAKANDYDYFKTMADARTPNSSYYNRYAKFSVMNFSNGFPGFANSVSQLSRGLSLSSSSPFPDGYYNDEENSFRFEYANSRYSGDFLEELQALSGTGTHTADIVFYNNFMATNVEIHPNKKWAYVTHGYQCWNGSPYCWGGAVIARYKVDSTNGTLIYDGVVNFNTFDYTNSDYESVLTEVSFSPSGQYAAVHCDSFDETLVFSVNQTTGDFDELLGHQDDYLHSILWLDENYIMNGSQVLYLDSDDGSLTNLGTHGYGQQGANEHHFENNILFSLHEYGSLAITEIKDQRCTKDELANSDDQLNCIFEDQTDQGLYFYDYEQINTIISDGVLAKYGETISFEMEPRGMAVHSIDKENAIIYWGGQDFIVALKFKHSLTDSAPISLKELSDNLNSLETTQYLDYDSALTYLDHVDVRQLADDHPNKWINDAWGDTTKWFRALSLSSDKNYLVAPYFTLWDGQQGPANPSGTILFKVDFASGAITMVDSFDGAVLSRISKFISK